MKMSPYEIKAMIAAELPSAAEELGRTAGADNPYGIMSGLSNFARKQLRAHNLTVVVKCLELADTIYQKGNLLVKNSVENIFIFSLTGLREICNPVEWKVIRAKMPETLHSLYQKQLYCPGT